MQLKTTMKFYYTFTKKPKMKKNLNVGKDVEQLKLSYTSKTKNTMGKQIHSENAT